MSRRLELRGRDYPELGELAVASLPGQAAIALSRGLYPKPYAHVDPNEDGGLVYVDEAGRLLAVVDGYNGVFASETTLDHVGARAESLVRCPDVQAFERAIRELLAELAPATRAGGASRTCLVLATLVGERCLWASFGDSFLLRAGQKELVSRENDLVLGPEIGVRPLSPELWLGSFRAQPGERIALVSDGVTNFYPDPEHITRALTFEEDDAASARALTTSAMRGGAGDNVTAVTATVSGA